MWLILTTVCWQETLAFLLMGLFLGFECACEVEAGFLQGKASKKASCGSYLFLNS